MTTDSRERDRRRLPQTAGGWRAGNASETRILDAGSHRLDGPRGLDRAVEAPRSARSADASLGRVSTVLESLVQTGVLIWDVALSELTDAAAFEPDRLQQLRRPLYVVDQGLRFGAGACDLGRELVASIQGHR